MMKADAADTINRLVQVINNEGWMKVRAWLVGSGKRNLKMQDPNHPSFKCYIESVNEIYCKNARTAFLYL